VSTTKAGADKRKLVKLLTLIETIGLESDADLRKRSGSRIGLMVETAREARDIARGFPNAEWLR
jgi:hypothetical protein